MQQKHPLSVLGRSLNMSTLGSSSTAADVCSERGGRETGAICAEFSWAGIRNHHRQVLHCSSPWLGIPVAAPQLTLVAGVHHPPFEGRCPLALGHRWSFAAAPYSYASSSSPPRPHHLMLCAVHSRQLSSTQCLHHHRPWAVHVPAEGVCTVLIGLSKPC